MSTASSEGDDSGRPEVYMDIDQSQDRKHIHSNGSDQSEDPEKIDQFSSDQSKDSEKIDQFSSDQSEGLEQIGQFSSDQSGSPEQLGLDKSVLTSKKSNGNQGQNQGKLSDEALDHSERLEGGRSAARVSTDMIPDLTWNPISR